MKGIIGRKMNRFEIRPLRAGDREAVTAIMRDFYASEAVSTNGSEDIFRNDLDACLGESPYAEGYLLVCEGETAGYVMLARSFSTEFGRPCVWIEDLCICAPFRGRGLGPEAIAFVRERYPDAVIRLEAERENLHAMHVYEKAGFSELPYAELILFPETDQT